MTDPQRDALERALGAQYAIVRLLGRGGMGAVYLGRERALERDVAIKVLPPDLAADAESRERFRREARTAARLTHPNIVPLYTFGDVEGMLYFVMGYVRGESLGTRLSREGTLPPEDARRILGELADALDYAHRQGVVHRDIKPDNILLDDESGRPMLTDFGVAKARASGATLTEAGAVVGTPHYMSPEQASGARDLDGRSDLYSLGVMGYQMLSGRLPFEGENFRDVIVQHVTQEAPPLRALSPDLPGDLEAAVTRALAKDPGARWQDARALRAALNLTDHEDDVPVREARLDAVGFKAAMVVWTGALVGLASYLFPGPGGGEGWWTLPAVVVASGPALVGLLGAAARRGGVAWPTIRRRVLFPPRWWPFWWPRAWRRPGDVWDRLPGLLRWSRTVAGASIACVLLFSLPLFVLAFGRELRLSGWLGMGAAALMFGPWYAMIGAGILPVWWARRRGIPTEDFSRFVFAPTSSLAFWRKPVYAAVLSAGGVQGSGAEPRRAAEYLRAVVGTAAALSGPAREVGSEVVAAARQLVTAVEELDREIEMLVRDADPAELASVERKLAGLGAASPDEPADRDEMRRLFGRQRELLQRLGQRLAAATERRARLLDLLRTLWLQLANLRAQAGAEAHTADTTGRIRAVLEEVERHRDAVAAVHLLTDGERG